MSVPQCDTIEVRVAFMCRDSSRQRAAGGRRSSGSAGAFKNIIYQQELNSSQEGQGVGASSGERQMIARHAELSARAHLVSVINQKFAHASLRSS